MQVYWGSRGTKESKFIFYHKKIIGKTNKCSNVYQSMLFRTKKVNVKSVLSGCLCGVGISAGKAT